MRYFLQCHHHHLPPDPLWTRTQEAQATKVMLIPFGCLATQTTDPAGIKAALCSTQFSAALWSLGVTAETLLSPSRNNVHQSRFFFVSGVDGEAFITSIKTKSLIRKLWSHTHTRTDQPVTLI